MRWAGYIARIRARRDAYSVLMGKYEERNRLGKPRHRREYNIKMEPREIACGAWFESI
jgi:hypothetical protein